MSVGASAGFRTRMISRRGRPSGRRNTTSMRGGSHGTSGCGTKMPARRAGVGSSSSCGQHQRLSNRHQARRKGRSQQDRARRKGRSQRDRFGCRAPSGAGLRRVCHRRGVAREPFRRGTRLRWWWPYTTSTAMGRGWCWTPLVRATGLRGGLSCAARRWTGFRTSLANPSRRACG